MDNDWPVEGVMAPIQYDGDTMWAWEHGWDAAVEAANNATTEEVRYVVRDARGEKYGEGYDDEREAIWKAGYLNRPLPGFDPMSARQPFTVVKQTRQVTEWTDATE